MPSIFFSLCSSAIFSISRALLHHVRQFGDDDRVATVAVGFDVGLGAHQDATAAGAIGLDDAGAAIDDAGGREVRTGHVLHQRVDRDLGIVDDGDGRVDHLGQVVRRNVRGHADRDAGRAVDQQVRDTGRQDRRFQFLLVVVRREVDGFLVDVGEQVVRELGHARFGVSHRRGGVAVDRTEVALPVHEHVAQRERLRHAHQRVVDRGIAVRVVLTDYVTDDTRRLVVRLVAVRAEFVHREQHAAMHRFQSIAHVGKRAPHDHAHGVIEVALTHLVFDVDADNFLGELGHQESLQNQSIARRPRRPKKGRAKRRILAGNGA